MHSDPYCEGCINGEEYRNYRINCLHRFLTMKNNRLLADGMRNIYFDAPWEETCWNTKHGCQLWRDSMGKEHTHIVIDRYREIALNYWRMIKRLSPESLMTCHVEWQKWMPCHSMLDATYGGEGMENEVASRNGYYDLLTPSSFAATFSPYIWSAKGILIPQLRRGLQLNSPAKYRDYDLKKPMWRNAVLHYIGLAAVNDVDLSDRTELSTLWWKAQEELGWNENTVFHPYYADSPALETTPKSDRIVASAYTNSGRLMLAVLNDTPKAEKVTVKLDLKKLGVKAGLAGKDAFEPAKSWVLSEEWSTPSRHGDSGWWYSNKPGGNSG